MHPFLRFSESLDVLPVVHGSGDFAVRVREQLLSDNYECVAVPLPGSWRRDVLHAIEKLPAISCVTQLAPDATAASYVPIDPCQPVIAALRLAVRERLAIEFVDLETERFEAHAYHLPDPYALKTLSVEQYSAAVLPAIPRPGVDSQRRARVRRMAFELHRLELDYRRTLFLPSVMDWPWIREAYRERAEYPEHDQYFSPLRTHGVQASTLMFALGELPFITALYESSRATLDHDENLSIDGVKQLVLEARDRWQNNRNDAQNWLTPKLLQTYFQYVRNLTLLGRRLSPDLYTLVVAAKQIAGDGFALALVETARSYPIDHERPTFEQIRMGIGKGNLPSEGIVDLANRLPGVEPQWRTCELKPEPKKSHSRKWRVRWDPYKQCSWPSEDKAIESFHTHVRDQAKAMIGADLARSEKFTTSVRDGIDIRETLRNWHTGDLYVKDIPPGRGGIEVVCFLFDVPADPDRYTWRTTWHAEHFEESTIGLFATDFRKEMIGPGIGRALYGGVFFIYPPRYIPDIWTDRRLPRAGPLEERLLAAAILHSTERHVAVVSPVPLRSSWKRLARKHSKKLIHLPLSRFSGRTVDRLRVVHVLNGKEVRSYAARYIHDI